MNSQPQWTREIADMQKVKKRYKLQKNPRAIQFNQKIAPAEGSVSF